MQDPPTNARTDANEAPDGAGADPAAGEAADAGFGPPFAPKSFGGAFVWAKAEGYVATLLRLKAGKHVPVSTRERKDMHLMLLGGRAVLEVASDEGTDRVELLPAAPVAIHPGRRHRVLALTEAELMTVYTPDPTSED